MLYCLLFDGAKLQRNFDICKKMMGKFIDLTFLNN